VFGDDDLQALAELEAPLWQEGTWFHNRTSVDQQVRYELAGPIWQTTAVTESHVFVDWDMGVESVSRDGRPETLEIRLLNSAIEPPPEDPETTLAGGESWSCSARSGAEWTCRPTDDRSAPVRGWPEYLPNPAQIVAMIPYAAAQRSQLTLPPRIPMDGMQGPENGVGRLRAGSAPGSGVDQGVLLASLSGDAPGIQVLDDVHDGAWSGHLLVENPGSPSPSIRGCWNIQASGQRVEELPQGHWTVTRAAQLYHMSIPASVPRL
jgi:hypothetical protein